MSNRYRFTDDEKLMLDTVFTFNPRPDGAKIIELAEKLAVSEESVHRWFNHKRLHSISDATQARLLQCKYFALFTFTCFLLIIEQILVFTACVWKKTSMPYACKLKDTHIR